MADTSNQTPGIVIAASQYRSCDHREPLRWRLNGKGGLMVRVSSPARLASVSGNQLIVEQTHRYTQLASRNQSEAPSYADDVTGRALVDLSQCNGRSGVVTFRKGAMAYCSCGPSKGNL